MAFKKKTEMRLSVSVWETVRSPGSRNGRTRRWQAVTATGEHQTCYRIFPHSPTLSAQKHYPENSGRTCHQTWLS